MKKWLFGALLPIALMIGLFMAVLLPAIFIGGFSGNSAYGDGFGWGDGTISEFGENDIPAQFLPLYIEAGENYHVPWNLLAAHHRVETQFSTIQPMISKVGAEGHLQFMPCTWVGWAAPGCDGVGKGNFTDEEKESVALIAKYHGYGVDADGDGKASMWQIKDAIFSAANYLAANGAADGHIEQAILTYNHSSAYLAEILHYATLYVEEGYNPIDGTVPVTPNESGFARPVSGVITSPFGYRIHPITGEKKLHEGVDYACKKKDPIPASKGGRVIIAGWQNIHNHEAGYGQYVRIDHGGGYQTTYGHLSSISVNIGQEVDAGTIIGGCGSTGSSTGNHLHFEIIVNGRQVNPVPYVGP